MTAPMLGNRARLGAALVLVVVFVAGVLTGMWSSRVIHFGSGPRGPHPRWGPVGDQPLIDSLNLTPAQHAKLDSILERGRVRIDSFWRGPGAGMRAIVDSTRNEVRAVLTPEQRARYDSLRAQRMRMRPPFGGLRGEPRGAPHGADGPPPPPDSLPPLPPGML